MWFEFYAELARCERVIIPCEIYFTLQEVSRRGLYRFSDIFELSVENRRDWLADSMLLSAIVIAIYKLLLARFCELRNRVLSIRERVMEIRISNGVSEC